MTGEDQMGARAPFSQDQQLQVVAQAFGLEKIPDDSDALMDEGLAELEQGCRCLIRAGVRFAVLKQRIGHGGFMDMLALRGESARRAREAMQVVALCAGLTPQQMLSVGEASPRKLIALASLGPETVRAEADAGRLATVLSLPVVKINEYVKDRRAQAREVERARLAQKVEQQTGRRIEYVEEQLRSRAYLTTREVLLARLFRARAETDLALQAFEMFRAEMQPQERSDLLHCVASEAGQTAALLEQLRSACGRTGGADKLLPCGELDTLPEKLLTERATYAAHAAELDLIREAVERQRHYGWKGRSVKSMESLIKQVQSRTGALETDDVDTLELPEESAS